MKMPKLLSAALLVAAGSVAMISCGEGEVETTETVRELNQSPCTVAEANADGDQELTCGGQRIIVKRGSAGKTGAAGPAGKNGKDGKPGAPGEPGTSLAITTRGHCQGQITDIVLDQQEFQSVSFYVKYNRFNNGLVFSNLGIVVVEKDAVAGQTVESPRMDVQKNEEILATDIVNGAAFQLHLIHPDDPKDTLLQLLDSNFNPLGMATCTVVD